jgi:hypothetical protein
MKRPRSAQGNGAGQRQPARITHIDNRKPAARYHQADALGVVSSLPS